MNRRYFAQQLALATATFPFLSAGKTQKKKTLKPQRLRKGDTMGMITPGSFATDSALEKAVQNVESLGFKVKLGKHIRAERGYNAGSDAERLADLHSMFLDEQVQGIWCVRGGYGCTRLLPMMDYKMIRKHPKALIGYSDITALHQAIHLETGLVSFHGPVAASDFTDYTVEYLTKVLISPQASLNILLSQENKDRGTEEAAYETQTINAGKARGKLAGGNLSLLAAMAGTKWELDACDKLVFIEEIGEKPYRIDRMLTQLRQTANLQEAKGLVLGVFNDCDKDADDRSLYLDECLKDRLQDLNKPTIYGLSFGHISNQCTLPIGIEAELDTATQSIRLLEKAVL